MPSHSISYFMHIINDTYFFHLKTSFYQTSIEFKPFYHILKSYHLKLLSIQGLPCNSMMPFMHQIFLIQLFYCHSNFIQFKQLHVYYLLTQICALNDQSCRCAIKQHSFILTQICALNDQSCRCAIKQHSFIHSLEAPIFISFNLISKEKQYYQSYLLI